MWSRLNGLDSVKPMVWLNNVPWHEMNVDDELSLRTTTGFCQQIEMELRQRLYSWRHMPCDMVVEQVIHSPLAVSSSGIGIEVEEDIVKTDDANSVVAHNYHRIIANEDDIEKIQMPRISHDEAKSREIFDGVLPVRRLGSPRVYRTGVGLPADDKRISSF